MTSISLPKMTFPDLAEREAEIENRIQRRAARLAELKKSSSDPAVAERLRAVSKLRAAKLDPVVAAVAADVFPDEKLPYVSEGQLYSGAGNPVVANTDQEVELLAVVGLLLAEGIDGDADPEAFPDNPRELLQDVRLSRAIARARGEYRAHKDLFTAVLGVLLAETNVPVSLTRDRNGEAKVLPALRLTDWARVTRELIGRGTTATDGYLGVKARAAFAGFSGGDHTAPASSIDIDLPDLEAEVDTEIFAENVKAMQAIYFAATLEEVRLFAVMDKLVELFHQGMLPIGRGPAGNRLFDYWKRSADRFTEVERRNLYARSFGFPGGDAGGSPNREFQDLWLRFISAVSEFNRQHTVDSLLRSNLPSGVSQEQVRKAGRDLAANLSLYGYGVAYFAATELQAQIREILDVLGDEEVRGAYGARDVWQVVDQVATLELGGARNGVRYRTMATAGAVIIRWLANNADRCSAVGRSVFINPTPTLVTTPGHKPMVDPTDQDLIDACEQWLAVTGTSDSRVEQYSQPVEGPNTTSRPIQIPAVARDLLDSVGMSSAGYSAN